MVRPLGCHLLLEPGRSIVAPAGVLLMRVLYTKQNRGKSFVVVDAAMNDFIRPGSIRRGASHHAGAARARVRAGLAARISSARSAKPATVSCRIGRSEKWPPGDLLVLWGAGAYGFVEASNYNSRPRPAEVLVDGSRFRVIRHRESRTDLVRGE